MCLSCSSHPQRSLIGHVRGGVDGSLFRSTLLLVTVSESLLVEIFIERFGFNWLPLPNKKGCLVSLRACKLYCDHVCFL